MEPEETMSHLRALARTMGIVDIGAADADAWNDGVIPEGKRPKDVMTSCRSVVVMGIPLQKTVLDTAPSIYYSHLYSVVNSSLDIAAERIALELNILGHDAVYVPRDGYKGIKGLRADCSAFFSHKHAAVYAGMGSFGTNGLVLTERHGPRMWFVSVLTSAELPCGKPTEKSLCIRCSLCVRSCPSGAISPDGSVDSTRCLDHNEELAKRGVSPCGRCVAVCPIGSIASAPPSDRGRTTISGYVLRRNLNNRHAYRTTVQR